MKDIKNILIEAIGAMFAINFAFGLVFLWIALNNILKINHMLVFIIGTLIFDLFYLLVLIEYLKL